MKINTIKEFYENPKTFEKVLKKKGVNKLRKAILKSYSKEIKKILIPTNDLSSVLPLLKKVKPKMAAEFERIITLENPEASEKEQLEALIKASSIF